MLAPSCDVSTISCPAESSTSRSHTGRDLRSNGRLDLKLDAGRQVQACDREAVIWRSETGHQLSASDREALTSTAISPDGDLNPTPLQSGIQTTSSSNTADLRSTGDVDGGGKADSWDRLPPFASPAYSTSSSMPRQVSKDHGSNLGAKCELKLKRTCSRAITAQSLEPDEPEEDDEQLQGCCGRCFGFLKRLRGSQPFFTPFEVPLDLIFFRRIFSKLNQRHGDHNNEIPVATFQRAVTHIFTLCSMPDVVFDAKDYDVDSSGAVGWYEFVTCWRRSKIKVSLSKLERIFLAIEDPLSCILGLVFSLIITALIFISCSCFIIGTLPEFQHSACETCEPEQFEVFDVLESICVSLFTVEYMVRLVLAPSCRSELLDLDKTIDMVTELETIVIPSPAMRLVSFVAQPMNIIDLLVIFPWYVDLILGWVSGHLVVLRVLRLTRLLRLVKLGRYFEILTIIVRVFHRSMRAIYVLFFYLVLGVCFSSATMYFAESGQWDPEWRDYVRILDDGSKQISPFKSIPHAFWWCIVTYTTVGYGDAVPVTLAGKIVATCTMLVGIMVLAMPISVVSLNFSQVWSEFIEESKMSAEAEQRDFLSVTSALQSLESRSNLLLEVFGGGAVDGYDSFEGPAEFLGEVWLRSLPVEFNKVSTEVFTLPLQRNLDKGALKPSGDLTFSYAWTPYKDPDEPPDATEVVGVLDVTVQAASGLPPRDWKSDGCLRDVRVIVHCWPTPPEPEQQGGDDGKKEHHGDRYRSTYYKTKTVCSLNPVWEEAASFQFNWPRHWRPDDGFGVRSPPARSDQKPPSALACKEPDGVASGDVGTLPISPRRSLSGINAPLKSGTESDETLRQMVEAQGQEIHRLTAQVSEMHQLLQGLANRRSSPQQSAPQQPAHEPPSLRPEPAIPNLPDLPAGSLQTMAIAEASPSGDCPVVALPGTLS